jgi:Uma2 family endonuclease
MSQTAVTPESVRPFKFNLRDIKLTDEQFMRLCQENPEFRLELTAAGELIIMPPAGSKSSWRSGRSYYALTNWADQDGSGLTFDSSAGFTLPNGAKRSPDVSWIKQERWNALTTQQQEGFAPLCPDFVIEVRSPSDRLSDLQDKMQEYIDNGARLGWLIDPLEKRVHIYHLNQPVELLDDPPSVWGDPVLPGVVLYVREFW